MEEGGDLPHLAALKIVQDDRLPAALRQGGDGAVKGGLPLLAQGAALGLARLVPVGKPGQQLVPAPCAAALHPAEILTGEKGGSVEKGHQGAGVADVAHLSVEGEVALLHRLLGEGGAF
nr:hypothetical protein [Acetanaerobacterium sp. MSJ-12]